MGINLISFMDLLVFCIYRYDVDNRLMITHLSFKNVGGLYF